MIHEVIPIREKGSMDDARMVTYFWENSPEIPIEKRPVILICPGGAYGMTSDREAEAVAVKIMSMGFHTAILRYSVAPSEFPTALLEAGRAVALLRKGAEKWHIQSEKIVVMGFSAGGHLAASYGVFWNDKTVMASLKEEEELLRPNALLLGYPVITSDRNFWHEGSFRNLLGNQWSGEMLDKLSLEKRVASQVPRTFVWHTFSDGTVPVENSLLWVQALCKKRIPVEFHLYEKGVHGLSLASELTDNQEGTCIQEECQSWIELAGVWLNNL